MKRYIFACLAMLNLGCIGINIITGNYWILPMNVMAFIACGGAAILND